MDYASLWDVRIFLDLFLGGIGVGIFLFMAFGIWGKEKGSTIALKIGSISSFALVAVGALLLMSELGKPFDILSTVTGFNATSITSWGGLLQMGFLLVSAILTVLLFTMKTSPQESVSFKIIGAVGVILASLILAYHGLVLNSVGRGLWANALITPLFMASSLAAGGIIAIAIDKFTSNILTAESAKFIAATSLCVGTLLLSFGFTVAPTGADAILCYNTMMEQSAAIWWLVVLGVGCIVPLALSVVTLVKNSTWNKSLILASAACVIVGSFALKYLIASTAQIILG